MRRLIYFGIFLLSISHLPGSVESRLIPRPFLGKPARREYRIGLGTAYGKRCEDTGFCRSFELGESGDDETYQQSNAEDDDRKPDEPDAAAKRSVENDYENYEAGDLADAYYEAADLGDANYETGDSADADYEAADLADANYEAADFADADYKADDRANSDSQKTEQNLTWGENSPGPKNGIGHDNGNSCSPSTTNSPSNRQCWCDGYNVYTDAEEHWPSKNVGLKKYQFIISNETLRVNGVNRKMMVVNKRYPGPIIEANWGDWVEVNVTNTMDLNGTGIHWHGIRQYNTNHMDGVGGVTECPIAKGETRTYRFQATQFGTSWYHSHYSVQYGEGIIGGIVVKGPAAENYDEDLGFFPMSDWFNDPMFAVNARSFHANGPPTADGFLINGTSGNFDLTDKKPKVQLQPGKKYLLRLANVGINQHIHVSLDGHQMRVIAADFIPVKPYSTKTVSLTVGQRYDVIIDANQDVQNYWFRVQTGGGKCDGPNKGTMNGSEIKNLFTYKGAKPDKYWTAKQPWKEENRKGCLDEDAVVPLVAKDVQQNKDVSKLHVGFSHNGTGNSATRGNLVRWLINDVPMHINYRNPTLLQILNLPKGRSVNDLQWAKQENIYRLSADKWTYWHIHADENSGRVPHPIHLHGHDFFILAQGFNSSWDGKTDNFKWSNPIRRDTATLPERGWMVISFKTDNPGAWLMHCHVPFHISAGFSLQFLESPDTIWSNKPANEKQAHRQGCSSWTAFEEKYFPNGFSREESGV